jgi:hypothetical protein
VTRGDLVKKRSVGCQKEVLDKKPTLFLLEKVRIRRKLYGKRGDPVLHGEIKNWHKDCLLILTE